MTKTNEESKCVWELNEAHEGNVELKLIFADQLKVPMCEKHYNEHMDIMILARNEYDTEKVLEMSTEDRHREVLTLKLSGMDIESVKP